MHKYEDELYYRFLGDVRKRQKKFEQEHQNMPPAKYVIGDVVTFSFSEDELLEGMVYIVDRYGTFEQNEEPSYDIYRFENNTLYKHIRQQYVKSFIRHGELKEMEENTKLHYDGRRG